QRQIQNTQDSQAGLRLHELRVARQRCSPLRPGQENRLAQRPSRPRLPERTRTLRRRDSSRRSSGSRRQRFNQEVLRGVTDTIRGFMTIKGVAGLALLLALIASPLRAQDK